MLWSLVPSDILFEHNGRKILKLNPKATEKLVSPETGLILDPAWKMDRENDNSQCWSNDHRGIRVILSMAIERDNNPWLHISMSSRTGDVPTWDDISLVRNAFGPKDFHGYMVFPPESEYVHSPGYGMKAEVLHLFYAINTRPLPDFRPDQTKNEI